ncbi:MAG: hypothetical protein Q9219_000225 [cf. Caloplaca sp. 3 TL-2023]
MSTTIVYLLTPQKSTSLLPIILQFSQRTLPGRLLALHFNRSAMAPYLGYRWGDFETRKDLTEAKLYKHTSRPKADAYLSPFRDPESPLDEQDIERFEVKTTQLARSIDGRSCHDSGSSSPEFTPLSSPVEYEDKATSGNSLPLPMLNLFRQQQQQLLAAMERLERRVALVETSVEQQINSLEQEVLGACGKLTNGINKLVELLSCTLNQKNDRNQAQMEDASYALAREYILSWRAGGLILVENLSEQTQARDIHALFQKFGRITYLELHAADKSRPHVAARHAYIHYAGYDQALEARRCLHGLTFQNRALMVFLLTTDIIRGEPGKPYEGPALEILNFNGGSNYAAPEADCFQVENTGLSQLNRQSYLAKDVATLLADYKQVYHAADPPSYGESHYDESDEEIVFRGAQMRRHPTELQTIDECDEEDGGVPLQGESRDIEEDGGVYLPSDYEVEYLDEDFDFCIPVQPREFL